MINHLIRGPPTTVPVGLKPSRDKKLSSSWSDDAFMAKILFDLYALWKCPFFPHFLQIVSFAGQALILWLGLLPQLERVIFLNQPLPGLVSDVLLTDLFDVFTSSIVTGPVSSL